MKEILAKAILRRALDILQKKWQGGSPSGGRLETFKRYLEIASQLTYPSEEFAEAVRKAQTITELQIKGFPVEEFIKNAVQKLKDASELILIIGQLLEWIEKESITLADIAHLFPAAFFPNTWRDIIAAYLEDVTDYVNKSKEKIQIPCPHCYIFDAKKVNMEKKGSKGRKILVCPKCGLSSSHVQGEIDEYDEEEDWMDEEHSPLAEYVDFVGADETDFWRDKEWDALIEYMKRAVSLAESVGAIAPNFKELVESENVKLNAFIKAFGGRKRLETLAPLLGGENIMTGRRTTLEDKLNEVRKLYEGYIKSPKENELERLRLLVEFYHQLGNLVQETEALLQEGHQTGFLGLALLPDFDVTVQDVVKLAELLKEAEKVTEKITELRGWSR